jgi:hypothetical protein
MLVKLRATARVATPKPPSTELAARSLRRRPCTGMNYMFQRDEERPVSGEK